MNTLLMSVTAGTVFKQRNWGREKRCPGQPQGQPPPYSMYRLNPPPSSRAPVKADMFTVLRLYAALLCSLVLVGPGCLAADVPSPSAARGASGCNLNDSAADLDLGSPNTGRICLAFPMNNQTKYEGETTRIECEITGDPLPDYRWYRNNVPISEIQQDDPRLSAKPTMWGSRLRIQNLKVSDSGVYRCDGQNRWGLETSQAWLTVKRGKNPRQKPHGGRGSSEDIDIYSDRDADFDDDDEIEYHPDYNPNDEDSAIPAADPNVFDPNIPGIDRIVPEKDDNKDSGRVSGPFEDIYRSGKQNGGFCQQYRGNACATFMSGKTIYVTESSQQGRMEERMTAALKLIALSAELSPQCGEYAIPTLCYYAFPECDTATQRPRQICKEECGALESTVCNKEFNLARQHHLMGHDFVLPNCEELADPGTDEGRKCIRIGLLSTQADQQPQQCYEGRGVNYRGLLDHTVSGIPCQRWTDVEPHMHYYTSLRNPELGDHNYCRNPEGQEDGPWCFTQDPNIRKQSCNIPKCSVVAEKGMNKMLVILVPCIAIVGTLGILLIAVFFCKRTGKPSKPIAAHSQVEMNSLLTKKKVEAREFPASALRLTTTLGESNCGMVYQGDLLGYYSDNSIISVLVKALPEDQAAMEVKSPDGKPLQTDAPPIKSRERERDQFYREMEILTEIKHPNILCMLGVKLQEKPVCMIFEKHSDINLQEYLVRHSPQSEFHENGGHILHMNELLHIITQIAAGMEYLACRNYIHKDLAARNCLITNSLVVKISNLDLIQERYLSDYYRVPNCERRLPVRWMPIEAILYGKLATESDVWSYGIVLWEVFSYGLQPYYGYNDQEVIDMIQMRHLLPCPDECPPFFYALMVECWHESPVRRPTFKQIHTRLIHWKADTIINNGNVNLTNYGPIGPTSHSSGSQHSGPTSQRSHLSSHPSAGSHPNSNNPSNNTTSTALTGETKQPLLVSNTNLGQYPMVHQVYRQPYVNAHLANSPYNQYNHAGPVDQRYLHSPPGSVTSDQRSSSVHSSTPSSASRSHGNGRNHAKYGNQQLPYHSMATPVNQSLTTPISANSPINTPMSPPGGAYPINYAQQMVHMPPQKQYNI